MDLRVSTQLEEQRELDGAIMDDSGRYCVTRDGVSRYGYRTHFAGLWVCYTCGHLCDCGDDE